MRLYIKVLASLQVILEFVLFFFFTFPNKWVGRVMGNEALNWDGLQLKKNFIARMKYFFTRSQDIPLRKWQGRESPEDEVES